MTVRSKRGVHLCKITDAVVSLLKSGRSVSEADISELCRDYPGDSRRALRRTHQCYSRSTELRLIDGIWTISPVGVVQR